MFLIVVIVRFGTLDVGGDVAYFRLNSDFFVAVPVLTFAYACHTNLPPVIKETKASVCVFEWFVMNFHHQDQDPKIYVRSIHLSVTFCFVLYSFTGLFGYLTFRDETKGKTLIRPIVG